MLFFGAEYVEVVDAQFILSLHLFYEFLQKRAHLFLCGRDCVDDEIDSKRRHRRTEDCNPTFLMQQVSMNFPFKFHYF